MKFAIFVLLFKGGEVIFEKEVDVIPNNNEMEHLVLEHSADYLKIDHRYVYVPPAEDEEVVVFEPVE